MRLRGREGARAHSICGRLCSRAGLCIRFPVMIFSLCIHNYHHRFFFPVFPPWKIEAPVISPGPCISNSHRVTFVGRRKKRTLEMTYAYYVCATVIDDETATLQHTHTGFFISSCFSGPSTKGPIWFRWPVTKHKKS